VTVTALTGVDVAAAVTLDIVVVWASGRSNVDDSAVDCRPDGQHRANRFVLSDREAARRADGEDETEDE